MLHEHADGAAVLDVQPFAGEAGAQVTCTRGAERVVKCTAASAAEARQPVNARRGCAERLAGGRDDVLAGTLQVLVDGL